MQSSRGRSARRSVVPPARALLPALLLQAMLLQALLLPGTALAADPEDAASGSLELEKGVYDFGVVEQNKEYPARIPFRNAGTGRITNLKTFADCGCYDASVSVTELAPGGTGAVTVRFRTLNFNGKISKTLKLIYEEGGTQRRASLEMTMKVYGGIVVQPGRLHFGEILHGTKPEKEVKVVWYEGIGTPFEIESVDVGGEPIETQVSPFTHVRKPGGGIPGDGSPGDGSPGDGSPGDRSPGRSPTRWKGWRIRFRFTEAPPRGVYSRKVTVRTTHPSVREVRIALTAHVVGPVWVQSSRILLGLVPQGTSKSAGVVLRRFDREKPLGAITAKSRKGVLQVSVEDTVTPPGPGPNDPPRPAKRVRVTVPEDAPLGPLDDDIEIKTGVPGDETVVIQVRGRVFERSGS